MDSMAPRKTYSAALKAQAVLELLKEDQTFGQVAAANLIESPHSGVRLRTRRVTN